ncbi:DUF6510 family protein [Microbacterium sp. 179-I 3D2 NHS]|uniref:DUF6510 family protein n=1 Tax=Microbacterium sp. 179-I 3D2 NHS TaxID=3235178 RepID=UPI0039A0B14D
MDADHSSTIVDGNCLAGMLSDLFGSDVTGLVGVCGGCGTEAPLAVAVVELDPRVAIVRCRSCTRTLFTVTHAGEGSPRIVFGALGAIGR